ncbi:DUF6894 family protein [uncultured Enterovirga sp.]|uniref:DUF6894 family protein n=1 Tax=uncultured Enterovirga sp. TaxID=2026352 RepID=UPI0035CAEA32
MPRFFFHVRDSAEFIDDVGIELVDSDDARAKAVRASGEMLTDLSGQFWNDEDWRMWVTDETGKTVCALRFYAEGVPRA